MVSSSNLFAIRCCLESPTIECKIAVLLQQPAKVGV